MTDRIIISDIFIPDHTKHETRPKKGGKGKYRRDANTRKKNKKYENKKKTINARPGKKNTEIPYPLQRKKSNSNKR